MKKYWNKLYATWTLMKLEAGLWAFVPFILLIICVLLAALVF